MTTKDDIFLSPGQANGANSISNQDAQYSNLNLNATATNHILETVNLSNSSSTDFHQNGNNIGNTTFDHNNPGRNTNQLSSNDNNRNGLNSNGSHMHGQSSINESTKNAVKATSNSTLSLHIAAYENATEPAQIGFNFADKDKTEKKKWYKQFSKKNCSPSSAMASFEIPRQQSDGTTEPEVMGFKVSQKLINPNEQVPPSEALVGITDFSSPDQTQQIITKLYTDKKLMNNVKLGFNESICVQDMISLILEKLQLSIEKFNTDTILILDKKTNAYVPVVGNYMIKPFDQFQMYLASKEQKMELIINYADGEKEKQIIDTSKIETMKELLSLLQGKLNVKEGKIEIKKFEEGFACYIPTEDDEKFVPTKRYHIQVEKIVKLGADLIPGGSVTGHEKTETGSSAPLAAEEEHLSHPPASDAETIQGADIQASAPADRVPVGKEPEMSEVVTEKTESVNERPKSICDKVDAERSNVSNVSQSDGKTSKSGTDKVVESSESESGRASDKIEAVLTEANTMPLTTTDATVVSQPPAMPNPLPVTPSGTEAKVEKVKLDLRDILSRFTSSYEDIVKACDWNDTDVLYAVVEVILELAINDSGILADLCLAIDRAEQRIEGKKRCFYDAVIRRCQASFDVTSLSKSQESISKLHEKLKEEEGKNEKDAKKIDELKVQLEEAKAKEMTRMVGLFKFIANLCQNDFLTYKIVEPWMRILLQAAEQNYSELLIEFTVAFMKEIGPVIVGSKKDLSNLYDHVSSLNGFKENVSARVQGMIDELMQLRDRKWSRDVKQPIRETKPRRSKQADANDDTEIILYSDEIRLKHLEDQEKKSEARKKKKEEAEKKKLTEDEDVEDDSENVLGTFTPPEPFTALNNVTYQCTTAIGVGESAVVYHARDQSGNEYAIRIADKNCGLGVLTECRILKLLQSIGSPYVTKLYASGQLDKNFYTVTDLLGPNLDKLIKGIELNGRELVVGELSKLVLAKLCLLAVEDVHKTGYVHLDVKSDNFIIGQLGKAESTKIYICDFEKAETIKEDHLEPGKSPDPEMKLKKTDIFDWMMMTYYWFGIKLHDEIVDPKKIGIVEIKKQNLELIEELPRQLSKEFYVIYKHINQFKFGTFNYDFIHTILDMLIKELSNNEPIYLNWNSVDQYSDPPPSNIETLNVKYRPAFFQFPDQRRANSKLMVIHEGENYLWKYDKKVKGQKLDVFYCRQDYDTCKKRLEIKNFSDAKEGAEATVVAVINNHSCEKYKKKEGQTNPTACEQQNQKKISTNYNLCLTMDGPNNDISSTPTSHHKLQILAKIYLDKKLLNSVKLGFNESICVEKMKSIILEKLQLSTEKFNTDTILLLDKKTKQYVDVDARYIN